MKNGSFRLLLLIAIIVGVVIRLLIIIPYQPEHGAVLQAAMAKGFLKTGEFMMQFGPIFEFDNLEPVPSRHFPPFYPLLIALEAREPDFGLDILKAISLKLTFMTALFIYFLTKKSFGYTGALFTTSLWMLNAAMIDNASKCLSENLQIITIITFLSLFFQSRQKPWMLFPACFALGLAYLTKSTLPFFGTIFIVLIAVIIICGSNRKLILWAGAGFIAFVAVILPWGIRNCNLFGTFDTSPYIASTISAFLSSPLQFITGLAKNILPMFLVLAVPFFLFFPEIKKVKLSDSHDFVLLFFSMGVFILSLFYATSFYVSEDVFLPINSIRYSLLSFIPLIWLILKNINWDTESAKLRGTIAIYISLAGAVLVLVLSVIQADKPLINEMDIALSKQCVLVLSEKEITLPLKVGFIDEINKNDFYYYLFALEKEFGIKSDIQLGYIENLKKPDILISWEGAKIPGGYHRYKKEDEIIDPHKTWESKERIIYLRNDYR